MRIIAIGSHFDDIEIACGGTLARAVAAGHQVKMLVLSDSSYDNYDGTVLRTRTQASDEGLRAARILGVTDIQVLDFPTKDVPYNSVSVQAIEKVLNKFNPDLIMSHWVFDTHQDHRNVGLATVSAARNFNNVLMYEPFPPSGRSYVPFRPQVYISITEEFNTKSDSLRAHHSQFVKYGEEAWIDAIKGRALLRGFESGHKYAEAFEPLRLDMGLIF